jgi:hypothetical protein
MRSNRTTDGLDITLRALFDALIIFSKRPFYPKGKLEMLPKKPLNLPKPLSICDGRGPNKTNAKSR